MKPHPAVPPTPAALRPGLADLTSPGHRGPPGLHLRRVSRVSYSEMKNGSLRPSLVLPLMGFPFGPKNICIQPTLTEVCSEWFSFPKGAQNSLEISEDGPLKTSKSGRPDLVDQDS